MHRIPHQQVPTPWSAPFPAAAAAPPGPAQQLPSPPNTASDRGSPPAGSITRRPKFDQKTGRQAGEDIFVCWLTPAPPSRFGPKFQKEWRQVTDPSRTQELSQQAMLQAQKYQEDFGLNPSSAAAGPSRPQQQPGRIPYPGPKPNVDISGLSKKDKKKIIEDWQRQVEEYTKQEKRDAESTEKSDKKNMKHQRSHSQHPMPVYQEADLQQQFLLQHQPPIAGPSNQSRRPSFSASSWQAQQPITPSQPQGGIGWPSPNQSTQLNRSNTFNGANMNSVRMPGEADDISDIEAKMRMATLKNDKSRDGYISAAEERGRERQRRISGGLLGLTSRSRSRAPEGGPMGYGAMDPSQVQNVWENAQQRQRKISTAERPAFYPQAGGANMGQYQQGVIPQQPSPNMQQGHGRRVRVNEPAKTWEQNTRINPGGLPQRDDDDDDDDDDWGDWHEQRSAPSQMPQQAKTPYMQRTPFHHSVAIQQQPQQIQFSTQPSPNTVPQQVWPSHSPMIPVQSQLTGGVVPSPMTRAGAFQPQPSPSQPQYIQMPGNGVSGQPSPMIQPNLIPGGVYPPGHIFAGKPVPPSAFTRTPAQSTQPLKTPAGHPQSFPTQGTNFGDQLAAKLSQVQPVPVAGGYAIPEAVTAAIARGQIPPGIPQPQQQQPYGLPQPPQLVAVPTGGGGGTLTSAGGIIPGGFGGPQQQPQPQPHGAQQRARYHQRGPSFGHMDSYRAYESSSGASPNPSADRGGAESDYELLNPPKRQQQQQHHQQHHQQQHQHHQQQQHQQQHQHQHQHQQQQQQHQHHEQRWQQLQRQQQQQQQQVRQTQQGPRFTPQGRFEPFIVIPDLNAPEEFPRLPKVLGDMRVTLQDWTAFMQEVLGAWHDRNPTPGSYGPVAYQVSQIVDKWNIGCFKPLGVDVAFFRGQKRKSGDARTQYGTRNDQLPFLSRAAPLDDDDDSSDDDDDDEDDDDGVASALGSQISHNSMLSGGRQLSAQHMLQLEQMRRERKQVLEEKRLARLHSRQHEPAHSIVVFPVIPA